MIRCVLLCMLESVKGELGFAVSKFHGGSFLVTVSHTQTPKRDPQSSTRLLGIIHGVVWAGTSTACHILYRCFITTRGMFYIMEQTEHLNSLQSARNATQSFPSRHRISTNYSWSQRGCLGKTALFLTSNANGMRGSTGE